MSDKLTALPVEVTIDDADLLYFVDVSDTTDDPAGSSKAIAKSDLVTPPPSSLDDLTDVDLTTTPPIATDVLTYDGTDWVPSAPAGGSVAMTDITDTDLTTTPPVADDFLKYDGTNWVPAVPAGGGGGAIDDLSDVDTTTTPPAVDDALVWDGTNWVPGAVSGGGGSSQTIYTKEKIATITASGSDFDFTSIPAGYDRLWIAGTMRSSATGAYNTLEVEVNGDATAANYQYEGVYILTTTAGGRGTADKRLGYIAATSAAANNVSSIEIILDSPDDTTKHSNIRFNSMAATSTSAGMSSFAGGSHYLQTAAINRLRFFATGGTLTGELTLYGEKEVTVGGGAGGGATQEIEGTVLLSTVTPTAGDFDFTIPSGYSSIILEGWVRSDTGGTSGDAIYGQINGDTTEANYHRQQIAGVNNATNGAETATSQFGVVAAAGAPATAYSWIRIEIQDPDDATRAKGYTANFNAVRASDDIYQGLNYVYNENITAAVTSFKIATLDSANLLGEIKMYGTSTISVAGTGGGTTMTTTVKELLDDQTNPVSGQFDFTIPSGYDRIWLEAELKSDKATADDLNFELNGDTTQSNYRSAPHSTFANGTHFLTQSADTRVIFVPSDVQTGRLGYYTVDLRAYDDATTIKSLSVTAHSMYEPTAGVAGLTTIDSSITDPITSLTIKSPADNLSGRVRLYGEKQATIGSGGSVNGPVLIETITNSTAGSFDFTAIPQLYSRLYIKGYMRSDAATDNDISQIYLNGDTTKSNYWTQQLFSGSSGSVANDCRFAPSVTGASSPSGYNTQVNSCIEGYTTAIMKQVNTEFYSQNTASVARAGNCFARSSITAAVTQITIEVDNHPTNGLIGELSLYGEI